MKVYDRCQMGIGLNIGTIDEITALYWETTIALIDRGIFISSQYFAKDASEMLILLVFMSSSKQSPHHSFLSSIFAFLI